MEEGKLCKECAAFRRWRGKRRPSRLAINGRIIGGERGAE